MNFNRLNKYPILWKLIRIPLSLIPKEKVVFILQGPLKGKKWIVGSSNNDCWIGCYEHDKFKLFAKFLNEGGIVFDIGANVGIYTLLSSKIVGDNGKVYAFEPNPRNYKYLNRHIELNNLGNVISYELAVSNKYGDCLFLDGDDNSTGLLSDEGKYLVETVSLDEFIFQNNINPPNFIKIDVEGAEYDVLLGAKELLTKNRPIIFLATHGNKVHNDCCSLLKSYGYNIELIEPSEVIAEFE